MTNAERDYIKDWLIKAGHDIVAAQTLIQNSPEILDIVCFHCQQAVEKYFKAYLVYKGKNIRKIHSVTFLQAECAELDADFNEIDLRDLDDFAIEIRYPNDSYMPELMEANDYLKIAEKVKELVAKKINLE